MTENLRPYLYYDVAISICSTCYRLVDAKIVFEGPGKDGKSNQAGILRGRSQ